MRYPVTQAEAYILGVLLGDGYLQYGRQRVIGLHCRNRNFALAFWSCLDKSYQERASFRKGRVISGFGNIYGKRTTKSRKGVTWREYPNGDFYTELYSSAAHLYFKDMLKRLPELLPRMGRHRLSLLVRGFYDSEGSYDEWLSPFKGRKLYKGRRIRFYNTEKRIIDIINSALIELGFSPYINKYNGAYSLRISNKKAIKHFFRLVGTSIAHKRPKDLSCNSLRPKLKAREIKERNAKAGEPLRDKVQE